MNEIEELRNELRESKKQQDSINKQLLELLKGLQNGNDVTQSKETNKKEEKVYKSKEYTGLRQPRPDSMIRVQSLTTGELCLNVSGRTVLRFAKYGDIKPVLYSELMNIVNSNRGFAENGAFYIIDDASVYYLGLSRFYENILSYEDIQSIEDYDDDSLKNILPKIPERQKRVICTLLARKVFKEEPVDRNKVDVISKYCDIDIIGKAREMREISNNMK